MDADSIRAGKIREARRELIRVLNIMYEVGSFSFPHICESLAFLELPDEGCIKRDLLNLCEKGFIRWTNKGDYVPWKERRFKLTAKGNDVAEALAVDPTLQDPVFE